jgi:thiosulfate dehydrogenase [quinone] large subunit
MQTATTSTGRFGDALRASWQTSRAAGWALLPLRLFLAAVFLYAGWSKLSNPQFLNPHARGYFGHFVGFLAKGSPISGFLLHVVAPHAQLFGVLVAYGEFAIGLGTLFGVLFRPAVFFGMFLNLTYYLSATWHAHPFYTSDDLDLLFAWSALLLAGAGGVALTRDPWLARWLLARVSPQRRAQLAPVLAFVLGVSPTVPISRVTAAPAPAKSAIAPAATKSAVTANAKKAGNAAPMKATNGATKPVSTGQKTSNTATKPSGSGPKASTGATNARSATVSRPGTRSTPSRRG